MNDDQPDNADAPRVGDSLSDDVASGVTIIALGYTKGNSDAEDAAIRAAAPCSFCFRAAHDIARLFTGAGKGAICDDCVSRFNQMLKPEVRPLGRPHLIVTDCIICGESYKAVTATVSGHSGSICGDCVRQTCANLHETMEDTP
jgi:ClpX C4-type zinc finger